MKIPRHVCHRVDCSDRFKCWNMPCEKQYANVYFVRSACMRKRLEISAERKWGSEYPITELAKLQLGVKSCIIGTLFKNAELQPSILKEVSEEHHLQVHLKRDKYISDSDNLILEDTVQRIAICGNINPDHFYTGTVIALAGMEQRLGQFFVDDYALVGFPDVTPLPIIDVDKYVLLISGLGFGSKNDTMLSTQLMVDYITGLAGSLQDQGLSASIIHMIIAGNSLSLETQDKGSQVKAKYLTYKEEAMTVSAMQKFDEFLSQLAPQISIDIMSGEYDPSNFLLPQQPLNSCVLPRTSAYLGHSVHTVTNPYECDVDKVKFLGTSGQNIDNIRQHSCFDDPVKLMEYTLECGHIAPTAPDSLGCFPYYKSDPFILPQEGGPHVYFAGNQQSYSSKIICDQSGRSAVIISVPSFHSTQTAVLVNLRDISCKPVTFKTCFPNPGVC